LTGAHRQAVLKRRLPRVARVDRWNARTGKTSNGVSRLGGRRHAIVSISVCCISSSAFSTLALAAKL
jgi:hypothetical protein